VNRAFRKDRSQIFQRTTSSSFKKGLRKRQQCSCTRRIASSPKEAQFWSHDVTRRDCTSQVGNMMILNRMTLIGPSEKRKRTLLALCYESKFGDRKILTAIY
jgi:hypothetical protein